MTKKKKTVLVVDDETDILLIVRSALETEDYEVITATSGPDALAKVKERIPDLAILDIMMPEMSGFDVLARFRETPETEQMPVIMLTGLSERKIVRAAIDRGIEYYITKPFDIQSLLEKVSVALKAAEIAQS